MKKRLGIFVFYDSDKTVDRYVKWLLEDLRCNLTDLIIVINGEVESKGLNYFKSLAKQVILRENFGLDSGAYSDVICDFLGQDGLNQYDEIVFSNDTYYGPFVPFQHIFEKMEDDTIDFWGLSWLDMGELSLLDAYFFVIKEKIIRSGALYSFFKGIQGKISDYNEACVYFEIGIFFYLKELNYRFATYIPPRVINIFYEILLDKDINFKLTSDPVLKKKTFSKNILSDDQCSYLLNCIQKNSNYEVDMVVENVARLYGRHIELNHVDRLPGIENLQNIYFDDSTVSYQELALFLSNNHSVYIYGTGMFGKLIFLRFKELMRNLRGFVVSDGQEKTVDCYGYPVKYFSELIEGDAAFLVSLSAKTAKDIEPFLKGRNVLYFFKAKDTGV